MRNYWDKVLERRISRRRAIAATGATTAAAAFLAACGGDDDSSSGGGGSASGGSTPTGGGASTGGGSATPGLLYEAVDSTSDAKQGGTYKVAGNADPQNFDLYNFDPFSQGFANTVGTKLVYLKPSRMADPGEFDVTGDLAQDWEISDDKLTYTFKLNPNKKFGPLSPSFHAGAPDTIGNRVIDSEDVLFSWERFQTISSNGGEFSNAVNPQAPVVSVEAPDAATVVMKLNKPYSPLLVQLANASVSYFYIIPKEGKGQDANFFNKYQFGGGPFYIDEFEPSVRLVMKRNPNFVDPDGLKRPYADEVLYRIIPDPTQQEAQFRAGEIFQGPNSFTTETNLAVKNDVPDLNMWALPDSTAVTEWFGMGADGPWKDVRMRQAVQYSWDRDLFIDVFFATDKLSAVGIPDNRRWNTAIPCGGPGSYMFFPGMWLDPQSSDFGENAKYFTLGSRDANIAEAKKLISAAGFPDGLDITHLQYPLGFGQQPAQDIIEGMMQDVGIRVTEQKQVMIPDIFNYIFGRGKFNEMLNTVDFGGPDVGAFMNAHFSPAGNLFGGWNPDDTGASEAGDATLNKAVQDVLFEFDNQKRVEIVQDFQRYMAKQFYYSRYPGGATSLRLAWPALQNWQTFRGFGLDGFYTYEWIDPTKKPLA
jgi:ABC-type transport system substrate-binding protein